jgi:hypothetical protein
LVLLRSLRALLVAGRTPNEKMNPHAGTVPRCEGGRPSEKLEPLVRGVSAVPAEDLEELGRVLKLIKSDDYRAFLAVFGHTGSLCILEKSPARKRTNMLLDLDRCLVNHIGAYLDYMTVQYTSPELTFANVSLSTIKGAVNMQPKLRNVKHPLHFDDIITSINENTSVPIKNDSQSTNDDWQNKHAFYQLPAFFTNSPSSSAASILTKKCLITAWNSTTGFHLQTSNLDTDDDAATDDGDAADDVDDDDDEDNGDDAGDSTSLIHVPNHTISTVVANENVIMLATKRGDLYRYSIDENSQIELLHTYDIKANNLTLSPDGAYVAIETVEEGVVVGWYVRFLEFNTFVEVKQLRWTGDVPWTIRHNLSDTEMDPKKIEMKTPAEKQDCIQIIFSPDSGSVLLFNKRNTRCATSTYLNLKTRVLTNVNTHNPVVQHYSFSPDSKLVMIKTLDDYINVSMVELWDSASKTRIQPIFLPSIPAFEQDNIGIIEQDKLCMSNDGKDLVVCNGNAIYLCNVGMGTVQQTLVDPSDAIGCAYINNTVVGQYCDGTIKIWQ